MGLPRRALAAVGAATALALGAPGAGAAVPRPALDAGAAILVDAATGDVLLERDADERRAIASATKLMTAALALERARQRQVFVAPRYSAAPAESKIDLRPGERMRVRDLLTALLLESANDAAVTLAVNIAGSRSRFVADMNARAAELGLRATRYANPIGLDAPSNYSTARDLAALARRLLDDPRFARTVDLPSARLRSGSRPRTIDNRNRLVRRHPFVSGVKTGHTGRAGYVLVGSARGNGAEVVSVVLGEPSEAARDADSLALLRWGLDRFERARVVTRGRVLAHAAVAHRDGRTPLAAARSLALTLRRGEDVERRVRAPAELEGPLPAGRRVGFVEVVRRGRVVEAVPLVTARAVPDAGLLRRVGFGGVLIAIGLIALVLGAILVTLGARAPGAGRDRAATSRR